MTFPSTCAWLSVLGAVLICAVSLWIEHHGSEPVVVLARLHDTDTRDTYLALPHGAMPRAERYGIVEGPRPVECVVLDRGRLIRPPGWKGPALLHVNRAAGEGLLLRRALRGRRILAVLLALFCAIACFLMARRPPAKG